ncbi:hypothetical protein [Micromonospora craterilacus]|uniref:hypothetical protein n=1 Tax=Micromonospora craterilacus TaxID=1655439 RepID=UPI001313EB9D|nr:hypothetical protein [Micromonospora craterilacus]
MSEETATGQTPAEPGGLVATAARSAGARMSARFDQVDVVVLAGLLLLGAGLWQWWSVGVALTVVGVLVLVVGILGAMAKPATAGGADRRQAGA